jgi:hypothetical protein
MKNSSYSIKNYLYGLLSEMEDHHHVDSEVIKKINDVNFSKEDDYIRISFETTYGKSLDFVAKYKDFKKWFKDKKSDYNPFKDFFSDFFAANAVEVEEESLNEIVDDNGDIMPDEDQPNNSNNSMVGSSVWDLERVYKSSIPKSIRFYSGDLGIGIITW